MSWKRGQPAMIAAVNRSDPYPAFYDGQTWRAIDGAFCVDQPTSCRPLVLIDPNDDEHVARMADLFCAARWSHIAGNDECDPLTRSSMRTALVNYARPKVEEPTGKYAVVVDIEGNEWVRLGDGPAPWMLNGSPSNRDTYPWFGIIPAHVLSRGIGS